MFKKFLLLLLFFFFFFFFNEGPLAGFEEGDIGSKLESWVVGDGSVDAERIVVFSLVDNKIARVTQ